MRGTKEIILASKNVHNPCHKCKERYLGCHDKCDKYEAYKKELDKARLADKTEHVSSGWSYRRK